MIGDKSAMLDGFGRTGPDTLARANHKDVLFAVSVLPYTRATIDIANCARQKRLPIVAITDSEVAPLAHLADDVVVVDTKSPSFLHA